MSLAARNKNSDPSSQHSLMHKNQIWYGLIEFKSLRWIITIDKNSPEDVFTFCIIFCSFTTGFIDIDRRRGGFAAVEVFLIFEEAYQLAAQHCDNKRLIYFLLLKIFCQKSRIVPYRCITFSTTLPEPFYLRFVVRVFYRASLAFRRAVTDLKFQLSYCYVAYGSSAFVVW